MSKREKLLLQLCISIALVGLSSIYLLMPVIKNNRAAVEEQEMIETQMLEMKAILDAPGIDEALEGEKDRARTNYEYFYSKLNSYSLDENINGIITDTGVDVVSMKIGDYKTIPLSNLKRNSEDADIILDGDFLLGCDVSITATGEYDKILNLISRLKAESNCVDITSLNLTRDERVTEGKNPVTATIGIIIYGIGESEFVDSLN
ncbi:MAG: hypothetical protein K5662_05115 [Lachnospiraceae bacterium]|nr:hypothetical protein [Lachnospiraceae bacterium]